MRLELRELEERRGKIASRRQAAAHSSQLRVREAEDTGERRAHGAVGDGPRREHAHTTSHVARAPAVDAADVTRTRTVSSAADVTGTRTASSAADVTGTRTPPSDVGARPAAAAPAIHARPHAQHERAAAGEAADATKVANIANIAPQEGASGGGDRPAGPPGGSPPSLSDHLSPSPPLPGGTGAASSGDTGRPRDCGAGRGRGRGVSSGRQAGDSGADAGAGRAAARPGEEGWGSGEAGGRGAATAETEDKVETRAPPQAHTHSASTPAPQRQPQVPSPSEAGAEGERRGGRDAGEEAGLDPPQRTLSADSTALRAWRGAEPLRPPEPRPPAAATAARARPVFSVGASSKVKGEIRKRVDSLNKAVAGS